RAWKQRHHLHRHANRHRNCTGHLRKTPGTEPELRQHHLTPTSSSPEHHPLQSFDRLNVELDLIQQATHTHQNLHPWRVYTPLENPNRQ
ncbi:unnamed protein product, partial [Brassica oleracea]